MYTKKPFEGWSVIFSKGPTLPNELCSFHWASENFCDGPLHIRAWRQYLDSVSCVDLRECSGRLLSVLVWIRAVCMLEQNGKPHIAQAYTQQGKSDVKHHLTQMPKNVIVKAPWKRDRGWYSSREYDGLQGWGDLWKVGIAGTKIRTWVTDETFFFWHSLCFSWARRGSLEATDAPNRQRADDCQDTTHTMGGQTPMINSDIISKYQWHHF